ncbi:ATP-binding protein [Sphingomonas koreensis]|uniref:ATP-binding protein n=1 Tax=Sphingomonas koreensis TaxID=93064 RepID=UPI000F7D5B7D|nr:ATP-binding protein [Sphingomonas koreensis]MDC7808818.1 ATP-binding protein [Sphingomonas koreensis]RSU98957.1 hypothetical protein CA256_03235 [Sphingomonas koreensis]
MTDPFFWLDSHNAIIGTSDAGKTWTAKWGVEELLRQRRHTLIWDPLGVWYGLRSSADGKGPGFDIPIFGGPHGDVPISPADGAAIARIITDQRVSAIIDVSLITNGPDQRRFARDLVAQLRRRRDRSNFHFVVDEADELVPEKTRDDVGFALQEDMLWIAKKGRSSGWVQTLITQRTADIAKSSLSMSQTIIAHQLVSPQDQKPFLDWVKTKGSKAELAEIESRLASLQRGERYLYSPRAHVLELAKTPAIATFDSSRTPPPGEKRREPRTLAQLDVSAIAAALAKPVEELRAAIASAKPGPILPVGGVPEAIRSRIADLEATIGAQAKRLAFVDRRRAQLVAGIDAAIGDLQALRARIMRESEGALDIEIAPMASQAKAGAETPPADVAAVEPVSRAEGATAPSVGPLELSAPQQRILDQLAWACEAFHRPAIERQVLAIVLGVHPRTKGFLNNLGALRSAGLIDYPEGGGVALTGTGFAQAARPNIAGAPLKQLRDQICKWLPAAQTRILRLAIDAHPNPIARDRLAELLNLHPRTKGFLNNLGRLRTLGLLAGTPAHPRAAGYLFGKD